MRLGLISDTHGKLRPEVFRVFEGVDGIVHAGDVGPVSLLDELRAIAPVTAVYGNTDRPEVRAEVPEVATLDVPGGPLVVLHGHQLGSPRPGALVEYRPEARILVYGHTHQPLQQHVGSCLVLNPGSAGAPRFGKSVSVGLLDLGDGAPRFELVELDPTA